MMKVAILKALVIIFVASGQLNAAVDEEWLERFPEIMFDIANMNVQYRAFAESARMEYDVIIKSNHARLISRIGFVAEDMKDFQNVIANEIEMRAIEINNSESECILEAQQELAVAAEVAGAVIVVAARDWSEGLYFKHDEFVTPVFEEIDIITSIFEIEVLNMLAYFNPVTQIENIVDMLAFEVLLLDMLFEIFVDDIYVDFILFEMLSEEKNEANFPLLNAGLEDFIVSGNLIRNSLANCNA